MAARRGNTEQDQRAKHSSACPGAEDNGRTFGGGDSPWGLASFLPLTSGEDPWVGPENESGVTRPLSATPRAAPGQPNGAGSDLSVGLGSARPTDTLLAAVEGSQGPDQLSAAAPPAALCGGHVGTPDDVRGPQRTAVMPRGHAWLVAGTGHLIPCPNHRLDVGSRPFYPKYQGHSVTWPPFRCITAL